jgi:hypothetical protein
VIVATRFIAHLRLSRWGDATDVDWDTPGGEREDPLKWGIFSAP